jgi:hypothetical protein
MVFKSNPPALWGKRFGSDLMENAANTVLGNSN